jgi:UDP-2,3-diacylglucosamine hydrolase
MTFLVSDLHIQSDEDPLARTLWAWLETLNPGDQVISLGDCFDLLVGFLPFTALPHQGSIAAIERAAERGVRMHLIEGNHDFHLHPFFERPLIYPDGFGLQLGVLRHWFEHGDAADVTPDYQVLRAFLRSSWGQAQLSPLSPSELVRFREKLHLQRQTMDLTPFCRDRAEDAFCKGYQRVWMGHTHVKDQWVQGQHIYTNPGQTRIVNDLAPIEICFHSP